jgi:hypothetical protein
MSFIVDINLSNPNGERLYEAAQLFLDAKAAFFRAEGLRAASAGVGLAEFRTTFGITGSDANVGAFRDILAKINNNTATFDELCSWAAEMRPTAPVA